MLATIWRKMRGNGMGQERAVAEIAAAFRLGGAVSEDDLIAAQGPGVYREMMQDAQVTAALQTKMYGILDADWEILSGGEDEESKRAAELARYALRQLKGSVMRVLLNALDALATGWSVQEINYRLYEQAPWKGAVIWETVKAKDPARFRVETDAFRNITGLNLHGAGGATEALPREKFLLYTYNPRYESPLGVSDLRAAYRHWRAKKLLMRYWLLNLEKFGSPTVKGSVPRNTPLQEREDLLRTLDRIHQETAIVTPDDVKLDLMDGKNTGGDAYLSAIQFHNREIAKALLGQTLTVDEGAKVGSLSLGRIHYRVMQLYFRNIRRELGELVMEEQLLRQLTAINFPRAQTPRFVWRERPELE